MNQFHIAILWCVLGCLCIYKGIELLPPTPPKRASYLIHYAHAKGFGHTTVEFPRPLNAQRIAQIRATLEKNNPELGSIVIQGMTELEN